MTPAQEFQWIAGRGIATWQQYDEESKVDHTSTALRLGRELIFFDPIPLAEDALAQLTAESTPAAIVLTTGNHERASAAFAERFQIPVFAHQGAAPEIKRELDAVLTHGAKALDSLTVIELPGGSPGEIALHCSDYDGVLVIGDALINLNSTGFIFLPGEYCTDETMLHHSVEQLLQYPAEVMVFAHGKPLINDVQTMLQGLVRGYTSLT